MTLLAASEPSASQPAGVDTVLQLEISGGVVSEMRPLPAVGGVYTPSCIASDDSLSLPLVCALALTRSSCEYSRGRATSESPEILLLRLRSSTGEGESRLPLPRPLLLRPSPRLLALPEPKSEVVGEPPLVLVDNGREMSGEKGLTGVHSGDAASTMAGGGRTKGPEVTEG